MSQSSESQQLMEALCTPDPLTAALREKIRGLIETMVDAELTDVLAAGRYERAGARRGYRHGQTMRTITTGLGPTPLTLPRGRVQQGPQTREWHSQLLPRYARRAGAVDASESTTAWSGLLESLIARGLRRPQLCVIDGNPGLRTALETSWPGIPVQRCTVHKLRNLERHAPRHAHEEIRAAYHQIVHADSGVLARQAYRAFVAMWDQRAPKVADSLREAGEELLTFYRLPPSQWKSARTTNAIERLHGEFRRRVKTQGALPTAQTAEVLLYGLLLTGQIRMRRIDGWHEMAAIPSALLSTAAA